MKMTTVLMAITAGLAMQALAAGPDNSSNPSASANTTKKILQQQIQVSKYIQPKNAPNYRIDRVGGISSRPWAQTGANYSASGPVLFTGDRERYHDVQFNLFWVGATPP